MRFQFLSNSIRQTTGSVAFGNESIRCPSTTWPFADELPIIFFNENPILYLYVVLSFLTPRLLEDLL